MKKCDITIDFYRPDREFRTGQTVQGWVRVRVNKELKCRALNMNVYWKTHGRGNTSRQNYHQLMLFSGQWQVGETYEYPFEFSPPLSPQTYHGHYLNIDHFVSVRADIPWAIDARTEEEFLWRIGTEAEKLTDSAPVLDDGNRLGNKIGLAFAAIIASVGIVFAVVSKATFALLAILPALLIAFFCLRSRLAEARIGKVEWGTLGSCYAGEEMPSRLLIGPIGNVNIKNITATLYGCESVTSGSGTDATTYTHQLYNQSIVLTDSPAVTPGKVMEFEPQFMIPSTNALSVDLPDNKIRWVATLAIRLKWWPDWVQSREIKVVAAPQSITVENPNPAFDTSSLQELIAVVRKLENSGHDEAQIEKVIATHADQLFTVSVQIQDVDEANSKFDDPEYQAGRTVKGTITGSNFVISLQLPSRYNAEVDALIRGASWAAEGAVIQWNSLLKQVTVLGI